ncbi:fungal-specific transcription factor domain-containing protein [Aspergillus avenaceus]|uniref:Fungal-specific transcription factor domain-containing protein n=1 Tax=Aspergillus avenaceus TaxID=36643 RepID=A0A5N6U4M2_ASPAV|nr:fungal-specific transcription factor domain-containing protein [Aspergillus avenaceus]
MTDQIAHPSRPIRKRRRPAHSCTECRRRKVRCDRAQPCNQCTKQDVAFACKYDEQRHRVPENYAENRLQSTSEQQPSPDPSPDVPTSPDRIRGTVSKTRVFGHGHWMTAVSMVDELSVLQPIGEYFETVFEPGNHGSPSVIADKVAQCKQLVRDVKRNRPGRGCIPSDLYQSFPNRRVMDELVDLYFATFEACYRVLHRPLFQTECENCMNDPDSTQSPFLLQLLLVMALAGTIHDDPCVRSEVAVKRSTWIHICQTWLSAPLEKDRLTIEGIQIHCLLLLARQVTRIGADLAWISVGSLIRMAMQMGLHQDPDRFKDMDRREKEIRRRLWYTILEMNLQTALDSGMLPMIADTDYNTQPPSDTTDHDLGDTRRRPRQPGVASRTSFQSLLVQSLPLRLRAVRVINSLQEEPPYDQVVAIGNELAVVCRNAATAIERASADTIPGFASCFCNHLLRRFILCLHFPHAVKSKKNPLYSYSQKACLEAAQDLLLLLEDSHYHRLLLTGGAMFRDIVTRAALSIFLELCPEPDRDNSIFARIRNRARQELLLQDARRVVQYAKDKMCNGETNVKVYVCLNMMLAHVEARLDGLPSKDAISKALYESLDTCYNILAVMAADTPSSSVDPTLEAWPSSGLMMPFLGDLDNEFDFLGDNFGFVPEGFQWGAQAQF